MARRRFGHPVGTDPLERDIEVAFDPGEYIGWREMAQFIRDLEHVAASINDVVLSGDVGRGVQLYEAFIAGCHLKANEIDDSSGHFSGLVTHLVRSWIRARQVAKADPLETARTLYDWHDRDDYGYFSWIERMSVDALDSAGVAAFEQVARERYEQARSAPPSDNKVPFSRSVDATADGLRTILAATDNLDSYRELCQQTETTAKDCLILAGMHERRAQPAEALAWVEQGLAAAEANRNQDMAELELSNLRLKLLRALGRADEAIAAAWRKFEDAPSGDRFATLMEYVPDANKPTWKEKAFAHAERAPIDGLIDLCTATHEWARLAARLQQANDDELTGLFYGRMIPAAEGLAAEYPDAAARLYVVLADQILTAKKAKAYHHALDYLAAAKDCLLRAGAADLWEQLVARLRKQHRLKSAFMPELEQIVAGQWPQHRPSFLEKAKKEWQGR